MSTLLVSSKGQIVLPADLRRKLGLGPGSRLEISEEPEGLLLKVVRPIPSTDVSQLAGLVKAKARGRPRSLDDFDPAALVQRKQAK